MRVDEREGMRRRVRAAASLYTVFGEAGYEAVALGVSLVGGGSPKTLRTEPRRRCSC